MKRFQIFTLSVVLSAVIFLPGPAFAGRHGHHGHYGHHGYHGGYWRCGILVSPGFWWGPPPPVYYYPPYPYYSGYYGYPYPYRSGYAAGGYYRNNTWNGGVIGAAIGALAGQAIGGNTESTLIGMGAGAVTGALAGNAADQYAAGQEARRQAYASPGNDAPPGEWVVVPGTWVEGKWVPSHRVWVPITP